MAADRIALIAIAVAAVGAFALLQVMACSRRRHAPSRPGRRRHAPNDWRTMPPGYQDDDPPYRDAEGYGPLWRYGSPRGYGHDYGPGYRPGAGPAYPPSAPHDPPPRRPS
jgi:hypothetical protein